MLYQASVYLIAGFIVLLIIAGVATAVSGSAQRLIFKKIGGAIYRAVTEEARDADRQRDAKIANAAELRTALDDFNEAVFVRTSNAEAEAARIRMICPDTRETLDAFLNSWRHLPMSPERFTRNSTR